MARLLITGGAGFIGSNFTNYWVQNHPDDRVIVLDSLTYAGNLTSLAGIHDHSSFRFCKGDICDTELVANLMREERVDTVVHFAAESHVDRSILGPGKFVETNLVGTFSMLEAARAVWFGAESEVPQHRFHHVSTDEVYGSLGPADPEFSEVTAYAPSSPYSASKAGSDHLVRAYQHTYGLDVTISNCSNNYGPYQFPEKLIPLMIVNALEGKRLPIYGDGSNIRDWLYVDDHVRGIELILNKGSTGATYNIGGNEEHANIDIVKAICEVVDGLFASDESLAGRFPNAPAAKNCNTADLIEFVSDRPGHDWRYAINATKISNDLGFEPAHQFVDGLKATVGWMLDNEAWWRAVLDESYRDYVFRQYGDRKKSG